MTQKELCYRYAELQAEIDALEAEQANIRLQIAKELDESGMEKFEVMSIGSFYWMTRKKFVYPAKILAAESKIKADKKKYEISPKAQFTESKSLAFRALKNDPTT